MGEGEIGLLVRYPLSFISHSPPLSSRANLEPRRGVPIKNR
jgi:hypothetical protein